MADLGPDSPSQREMTLRLDALSQDRGARPLGLGQNGVHDQRHLLVAAVVQQREVDLDHVRRHERHQSQRAGFGADVVQGDTPTHAPGPRRRPENLGRRRGQRPLAYLHHDAQLALGSPDRAQEVARTLANVRRAR